MDEYDVPKNPAVVSSIALLCGLIGAVMAFFVDGMAFVAIILGAVGMVAGGYSINLGNHMQDKDRIIFMAISGLAIMTSVLAFMFGLSLAVGV